MFFSSQKDPTSFDRLAAAMLHGKGYDRWFDKSFTLVVTKNGRVSCFLIYLYLLEILSDGLNLLIVIVDVLDIFPGFQEYLVCDSRDSVS